MGYFDEVSITENKKTKNLKGEDGLNSEISDDQEELANILANRLARIFVATCKGKIRNEGV
jgi:hypothetical protein